MDGILNYAFDFFYEWLFGTVGPISFLQPYADSLAMFFALFTVVFGAWFMFKLSTALVRLVYYMFER